MDHPAAREAVASGTGALPPALAPDPSSPGNDPIESSWAHALASVDQRALPAQVRDTAERSMMDTLACIAAGRRTPTVTRLASVVNPKGGNALAATWSGLTDDAPARDHALMLGTMAHINDLDDVCWTMMGHPSAPVVSAAIAALTAISGPVHGGRLVGAVAVGLEATIDLGARVVPAIYERGWHATSVVGVVGAAVAVGSLIGLSSAQLSHAMGIAASSSSGLRINFGSDTKSLHVGRAASLGLEAAMMARNGMTADKQWLTGRFGFFDALLGPQWRANDQTRDARRNVRDWLSTDPGILIKLHASCAANHPAADAAILLRDHILDATGRLAPIARIDVTTPHTAALPLLDRMPTTPLEAKFSMEYCVAHALQHGSLGLAAFTAAAFDDASTTSIMHTVSFTADPPSPTAIAATDNRASAATVTVTLGDGRTLTHHVDYPAGSPENPLSSDASATKVADCWRHGGGKGSIDDTLRALASADDVAVAVAACAPAASPPKT